MQIGLDNVKGCEIIVVLYIYIYIYIYIYKLYYTIALFFLLCVFDGTLMY